MPSQTPSSQCDWADTNAHVLHNVDRAMIGTQGVVLSARLQCSVELKLGLSACFLYVWCQICQGVCDSAANLGITPAQRKVGAQHQAGNCRECTSLRAHFQVGCSCPSLSKRCHGAPAGSKTMHKLPVKSYQPGSDAPQCARHICSWRGAVLTQHHGARVASKASRPPAQTVSCHHPSGLWCLRGVCPCNVKCMPQPHCTQLLCTVALLPCRYQKPQSQPRLIQRGSPQHTRIA